MSTPTRSRLEPTGPSAGTLEARRPAGRGASRLAWWRLVGAGPVVAAVTVGAAVAATRAAGIGMRDPDNVAALYLALVGAAIVLLVGLDIALRAERRPGERLPTHAAMGEVRRERWTRRRTAAVGVALVSFYVSYFAYRNLKGTIPLLTPDLVDAELAALDRAVFAGRDPAALLHAVLGRGVVVTHVLSALYAAFIVFLPLSLALGLVFLRELEAGLFWATALSANWVLGAGSYFLLPSLGPVYADPSLFAALPDSEVTRLQELLLDQRVAFLADPATATPQAIAAFASLHVAMSFTAALAARLLGLGGRLQIALWTWLALTVVATIHFGWHYVSDDVAGLAIGALGLLIARALTGYRPSGYDSRS